MTLLRNHFQDILRHDLKGEFQEVEVKQKGDKLEVNINNILQQRDNIKDQLDVSKKKKRDLKRKLKELENTTMVKRRLKVGNTPITLQAGECLKSLLP